MSDRFASLLALEALGLLTEPLPDEARMHLRTCEACLAEYLELRSISDTIGSAEQRGDAGGPTSPESLKSLVLRIARSARSPIARDAPTETTRHGLAIHDRAFVECAPGVRWAVAGDDDITLVYRIIRPSACDHIHDVPYDSTKVGVVLEGSFTIRYTDDTRQLLNVWEAYTVAAGVMHSEEYHERARVFEVYTPRNRDFEERYQQQVRRRDEIGTDDLF